MGFESNNFCQSQFIFDSSWFYVNRHLRMTNSWTVLLSEQCHSQSNQLCLYLEFDSEIYNELNMESWVIQRKKCAISYFKSLTFLCLIDWYRP